MNFSHIRKNIRTKSILILYWFLFFYQVLNYFLSLQKFKFLIVKNTVNNSITNQIAFISIHQNGNRGISLQNKEKVVVKILEIHKK